VQLFGVIPKGKLNMKPSNVEVLDIKYRRPGLNKVEFQAEYPGYYRRGTVVYDTKTKTFVTHNKDVELLAAICTDLYTQKYRNRA
jgi:hypothetical protein